MFTAVSFYVLWLIIVGCLVAAVPVLGVLTLAAGLTIAVKRPGR
jgi:hypothetical protein